MIMICICKSGYKTRTRSFHPLIPPRYSQMYYLGSRGGSHGPSHDLLYPHLHTELSSLPFMTVTVGVAMHACNLNARAHYYYIPKYTPIKSFYLILAFLSALAIAFAIAWPSKRPASYSACDMHARGCRAAELIGMGISVLCGYLAKPPGHLGTCTMGWEWVCVIQFLFYLQKGVRDYCLNHEDWLLDHHIRLVWSIIGYCSIHQPRDGISGYTTRFKVE